MIHLERELPDGSKLTFDDNEKSRIYRHHPLEGKPVRLTSVTTILDVLAKRALYSWHEEQGAIGAVKAVRLGEIDETVPDEDIAGRVRLLGLGAQAAKTKAAKRGLDVHDALEVWSGSGELPSPSDMDPEHRPYYQGLVKALLALDPEPIVAEEITCSLEHSYAGRFDLRAMVQGSETLLDLKSSRSGHGWPEGHVQLCAYDVAEQELGRPPAERKIVLGVGPDGEFNADECCATTETWLGVLGVFRSMKEVNRAVDSLKKAAPVKEAA